MTVERSGDTNRSLNSPNEQQKISIFVVDDRPIVREGVMALLASQADMEVVNTLQDGKLDLSAQEGAHPDVILFDFAPNTSVFGIAKKYPSAKIIVFTDWQSEEHIYQAIQAGARAYLDKRSPLGMILDCIRTVTRGQTWIPQEVAELLARRMAAPRLTRREQDVLFEMAQGKSNKQIGTALCLSEGTVKVYMTHILGKLKVSGRLEALAAATERGLVSQSGRGDYEIKAAS